MKLRLSKSNIFVLRVINALLCCTHNNIPSDHDSLFPWLLTFPFVPSMSA